LVGIRTSFGRIWPPFFVGSLKPLLFYVAA
jgi:hypothetical protein